MTMRAASLRKRIHSALFVLRVYPSIEVEPNVPEFSPDDHADPEREPPGECSGPESLSGQQQFLVR